MSGARVEKVGPWGGSGGEGGAFESTTRLARIKIHHLNAIRALEFQYEINGALQWSPLWGSHKDSQIAEIVLQPGEFLSSISGHTGSSEGYYVVTSLTLTSNIRKYGPFGKEVGSAFGLPQAGNSKIVGFYGKAGGLLDSIGVYLETYPDFVKVREDLEKKVAKLIEENNSLKARLENTKSLRILSKMDESYSLAARQDGGVGFVQSNFVDKYQLWNKYLRDDSNLRDSEGFPCFAIVNQATLEAIQYRGPVRQVGLVPYDPNTVDASILWTEGKDTGEGFHYVRSVNNINYIWDAFNATTKLHEGIRLGINNMLTSSNQLWKIQPWA